jgi:WD40 repeat protein
VAGGALAPARRFVGHRDAVAALAFPPGGELLASGSDDGTLKLLDLVSGEERATLTGHRGHVNALAVGRGGGFLLSAGGRRGSFGDLVLWLAEPR